MSAPAGWYPDASGTPRWWDGTRWADAPVPSGSGRTATQGASTHTVWAWLIAVLPLVVVVPSILYLARLEAAMIVLALNAPDGGRPEDSSPFVGHMLAAVFSPWYFGLIGASLIVYGLGVWFAFLDARALRARGFAGPFHPAWMFLSAWVYLIGRAAVLRRRGARGAAPMWTFIAIEIASIIVITSATTEFAAQIVRSSL